VFSSEAAVRGLALPERYIVSKVHRLARKLTSELNQYGFSDGSRDLYDFVWSEFADWFIEVRYKIERLKGSR
jgi:valyl-tRNA synthetase